MSRPTVQVYNVEGAVEGTVVLPKVFDAPIRSDLTHFCFVQMAKNKRQPYAVKMGANEQTPAISWGPGRAVSRIPRVPGSGTHRAGQGAFGNMCKGGRMFNPNRAHRRWHRKINVQQKRYAVASALAASAVTSLVSGRGHKIEHVKEIPMVVSNAVQEFTKTSEAAALLKAIGAYDEVEHVQDTKTVRAGRGTMRGRRYKQRRGPLIIFEKDDGIYRAFRNIAGVEVCCVDALNLLQLCPGGHLGRFCIWTQAAFEKLDTIFEEAPRGLMTETDLATLLKADSIKKVLRNTKITERKQHIKRNPLKNKTALGRLNPAHKVMNM